MDRWTRRKFFLTSLAGSAFAGASKLFGKTLEVTDGNSRLDLRFSTQRHPAARGRSSFLRPTA